MIYYYFVSWYGDGRYGYSGIDSDRELVYYSDFEEVSKALRKRNNLKNDPIILFYNLMLVEETK